LVHGGDTVFTTLGLAGLYMILGMLFLFLVFREVGHGPQSLTEVLAAKPAQPTVPTMLADDGEA
jgi:cytochrome d ubiquinol oxidase subunit I